MRFALCSPLPLGEGLGGRDYLTTVALVIVTVVAGTS